MSTQVKTSGRTGINWKFVVALLAFAGVLVLLVYLLGGFDKDKKSNTGTEAPKAVDAGEVYSLSRKQLLVPKEVLEGGASRAVPMTNEARKIIHEKYSPSMVGVPGVGEPFRLYLPRPISDETLKEIIEAVQIPGEEIVFIKTTDPEVVFGFMNKITGEMEAYCQEGGDECTPVDVFITFGKQ